MWGARSRSRKRSVCQRVRSCKCNIDISCINVTLQIRSLTPSPACMAAALLSTSPMGPAAPIQRRQSFPGALNDVQTARPHSLRRGNLPRTVLCFSRAPGTYTRNGGRALPLSPGGHAVVAVSVTGDCNVGHRELRCYRWAHRWSLPRNKVAALEALAVGPGQGRHGRVYSDLNAASRDTLPCGFPLRSSLCIVPNAGTRHKSIITQTGGQNTHGQRTLQVPRMLSRS